jgi:hypothetical protein
VGTDTEKRSAGVSRAAYSVLRCLEMMKNDENLGPVLIKKEFKVAAK